MELKSLILGLVLSLGGFAVKSGAGIAYVVRRESGRKRIALLFGIASGYGALFAVSWYIIHHVDLSDYMDKIMLLSANGMTLHVLFAALLMLWGITLLRRPHADAGKSQGWLFLALPCPVCFSVIFSGTVFLVHLYPDHPFTIVWLFLGFTLIAGGGCLFFLLLPTTDAEHSLGAVMLVTAMYFFLTVFIVPQFGDIEKIYRISRSGSAMVEDTLLWLLIPAAVFLYGAVTSFLSHSSSSQRQEV